MAACAAASAGGVAACHRDPLPSYSSIQAGKKRKKPREHRHSPQKHGPQGQHRQAQRDYRPPQAGYTQGDGKQIKHSEHETVNVMCVKSGAPGDPMLKQAGESLPEEFLGWALFSMCCCMCPVGLLAVKKSRDVRDALSRGDIPAARSHSKTTLLLIKISIILGVLVFVALIVYITIYFLVLV